MTREWWAVQYRAALAYAERAGAEARVHCGRWMDVADRWYRVASFCWLRSCGA